VEHRTVPVCGATAAYYLAVETNPAFRERQRDLEEATARRMALGTANRMADGPVTIPVVVHVVYNEESENISDAQIESQISVLNQDFRGQNPNKSKMPAVWEGLIVDTHIQFALASEDPAGDATTGITRTKTDRREFGIYDTVKSEETGGRNPWPTDRYLNIWVCDLAGGLLGYAQFPGGPPETDGVVIRSTAFGTTGTPTPPYNGGQTCTHEVGHFLNLYHIWGLYDDCTGGDMIADTPNAAGPNYGTPNFPHVSCNNGPNGDMFMNFMDYTNDAEMYMFTPQQVARMVATLEGPRSGLGRS
jgi:Pregnancy-associated plasma protein-A